MSSTADGLLARAFLPGKEAGPVGADEESTSKANQHPAVETEVSDESVMLRVADGDREALAILFRRYACIVRGVAYKVLRDASEADDLLQDLFLLLPRFCRTFDPAKGSARTWILQMTYRRAISRRRYLTFRRFYTYVHLDEAPESYRQPESSGPAGIINGLIGEEALRQSLEELSENQRRTLELYFFEGYTLPEIATELGQTTGNVSHHYYRGLEKLRRRIFGSPVEAK